MRISRRRFVAASRLASTACFFFQAEDGIRDLTVTGVQTCALPISVPRSVADPRFDASVNVLGTLAVLDAARRVAVRRVVYISTGGAVYGDTDVLPTPEDHPTRPASPYGVSKLAGQRSLECGAGLTGTAKNRR